MLTDKAESISEEKIIGLADQLSSGSVLFSRPQAGLRFFKSIPNKLQATNRLYAALIASVTGLRHLTQEVEWILDNFYIIEGALTDIKNGIRKQEFLKLPHVASTDATFTPRVFAILSQLLKTTNNLIDKKILNQFITVYQRRAPLALRELSEMPNILKLNN